MAAWGLFGCVEEKGIQVLPDCWNSFQVFSDLSTQWRVGFSGASGLDYSVIREVARFNRITDEEDLIDLFHDIRVMERQALEVMHKDK